MLRRIPLGNMKNLRDLGGYPSAGESCTRFERFLRGDNPAKFTEADIQWLLDRDITTVIDLRSDEEVDRQPDQLSTHPDFTYHHCSLAGGEMLPNLEEDVARGYFDMLDRKVCIGRIFHLIAGAPDGVLYHCTAGKDRTGVVSALILLLAGVCREDILADYQVSEIYLAEIIRQITERVPNLAAYAGCSKREYLEGCLERLEAEYGTVQNYLLETGITPEEQERIRVKLTEERIPGGDKP